jgi:LmbE family N-acetylglucosaminyl deacetylase
MAGRARPQLRRWHRRFLASVGRDVTASITTRSALVLAPHPDDETLGCGLTIRLKTRAGSPVRVVVAADGGDERRRDECREACRRLGVAEGDVRFLGFADGRLGREQAGLDQALLDTARGFDAADVFAPCAIDNHPDHRALAGAASRLVAMTPASRLLAYPVWFWNRYAWTSPTRPPSRQLVDLVVRPARFTLTTRPVVVRAPQELPTKRDALAAHTSQLDAELLGEEVLDPEWLETFLQPDEVFFP